MCYNVIDFFSRCVLSFLCVTHFNVIVKRFELPKGSYTFPIIIMKFINVILVDAYLQSPAMPVIFRTSPEGSLRESCTTSITASPPPANVLPTLPPPPQRYLNKVNNRISCGGLYPLHYRGCLPAGVLLSVARK